MSSHVGLAISSHHARWLSNGSVGVRKPGVDASLAKGFINFPFPFASFLVCSIDDARDGSSASGFELFVGVKSAMLGVDDPLPLGVVDRGTDPSRCAVCARGLVP